MTDMTNCAWCKDAILGAVMPHLWEVQPDGHFESCPSHIKTPVVDKKKTGLIQKYVVKRTDGQSVPLGNHPDCDYFVLDLTHDPLARTAAIAYAEAARKEGYHALAVDLLDQVLKHMKKEVQ